MDEEPERKMSAIHTLLTGGAIGADSVWVVAARKANHRVVVWSFHQHRIDAQILAKCTNVQRLTDLNIGELRAPLQTTACRVKKCLPTSTTYTFRLLARNYCIARDADAMYAVGTLQKVHSGCSSVGIDGGTGWVCQLFADKWMPLDAPPKINGDIPLYFFSVDSHEVPCGWYHCHIEDGGGVLWKKIERPPHPSKFATYAGVGTRNLVKAGADAIDAVFTVSD